MNYKRFKKIYFGDFIGLDPDSSNFVDPAPDTINPDRHHWFRAYTDEQG